MVQGSRPGVGRDNVVARNAGLGYPGPGAWTTWASYGRTAGVAAAVVVAVTPAMVLYGHTIEAEMPMIGTSMLAVAAAAWYYRTRARGLVVAAGLLLGLGVEMKLLAVFFL